MDREKIKVSPISMMIIQMILAMSFSILQHCCAQSSSSGFRHFQPESAEDSCLPHRRFAATLWKILVMLHNYPQVSARNNHGILRRKLSFPCHVPYMWNQYGISDLGIKYYLIISHGAGSHTPVP